MRRGKRVWKKICLFILLVLLALAGWLLYGVFAGRALTVSSYSVPCDINTSIRIVHISDLHNAQFGEENSQLVEAVANQQPDLIFMTGDMLNRDEEDLGVVCPLISALGEIAPVWYGYGNHEATWQENWNADLAEALTQAGAEVVNNRYVDTEVRGVPVRIGGYMGYYRQPHMMTPSEEQKQLELAFADEFEQTDRLKLLLNHIPTQWVDWGYVDTCAVDVVFSGHFHGGMIRLPLIDRGVYAPYLGFFPPFTKGVFTGKKGACVLSAGLGTEHWVPRVNNPPELVVIDLIPDSGQGT